MNTNNHPTFSSISDGTNSYTSAIDSSLNGNAECAIWYKQNASAVSSGATLTVTLSGTVGTGANGLSATLTRITTIKPSGALDKTASAIGTNTSLTATTASLSQPREIAVGATLSFATTYSGASGFPNVTGGTMPRGNGQMQTDYKSVLSNSAISYSPAFNTSQAMNAVVATFEGQ